MITHTERMIILIFGKPFCEVCTSSMPLGHQIGIVCIGRRMFVLGLWLRRCCVGRVRNLGPRPSQGLEHGRVEAGTAFFVDNLANKTVIPVGRSIPHLREAVCQLALYLSEPP